MNMTREEAWKNGLKRANEARKVAQLLKRKRASVLLGIEEEDVIDTIQAGEIFDMTPQGATIKARRLGMKTAKVMKGRFFSRREAEAIRAEELRIIEQYKQAEAEAQGSHDNE